jgi:hypothetical protein
MLSIFCEVGIEFNVVITYLICVKEMLSIFCEVGIEFLSIQCISGL